MAELFAGSLARSIRPFYMDNTHTRVRAQQHTKFSSVLHRRFVSFGTSDNNVALIRVRCQTAAGIGSVATRWVSALTLVN